MSAQQISVNSDYFQHCHWITVAFCWLYLLTVCLLFIGSGWELKEGLIKSFILSIFLRNGLLLAFCPHASVSLRSMKPWLSNLHDPLKQLCYVSSLAVDVNGMAYSVIWESLFCNTLTHTSRADGERRFVQTSQDQTSSWLEDKPLIEYPTWPSRHWRLIIT